MNRRYNENNPYTDDDKDDDEYAGYTVTDAEGAELLVRGEDKPKKNKKENYDDGETVEASPIPENEQTVMIDNAKISGLSLGDLLTLKVTQEESAAVYNGYKKAGDLKPAFVKKLLADRKGMHAECFLFSTSVPVMIKIKFYARARKNTVKI